MNNINSYAGKILYVNLSTGETSTESTKKYFSFLGGRGIQQLLLYKNVRSEIQPLDPENIISFGTGLLSGTLAPTAGFTCVVSKNYATGGIGFGHAGGKFGPELKYAGYDIVAFKGRARNLVWVLIDDGDVRIYDARELQDFTTWEVEEYIHKNMGDQRIQIASIGPAGENRVMSSCIIFNRSRAQGGCGHGAVLGSKNLKAVAVRGSKSICVAEPKKFLEAVEKSWEKLEKSSAGKLLSTWGTHGITSALNELSLQPIRNFQDTYLPLEKLDKIKPEVYKRKYEIGRIACATCPIYCSHLYKINEGPYSGLVAEGFEANTTWDFACRFDIDYAPWLIKAHALCSQFGLDVDQASAVIAWAFECYQRGLLTEIDTDGLKLEWGDFLAVERLLKKLAFREGFGNLLAEGSKQASKKIGRGTDKYAFHIKGQDLKEALRPLKGWALGVVVATRGGRHLDGAPQTEMGSFTREDCIRLFGVPTATDPTSYEGKAKLVIYYEKFKAVCDTLGLCYIASNWISPDLLGIEDYVSLLNPALGSNLSSSDLLKIGDRIHNVGKAFNTLHAGFKREDDYPPWRFMEEPAPSGPFKGQVLERAKWDSMLDEYYETRNWSRDTSWQTRKCLEDLDLPEMIIDLEKRRLL